VLRLGLIGAGLIGSAHATVLRQIADVAHPGRLRLVAVADPLERQRQEVLARCGFEEAHADAASLLRHSEVDAVFICTPTRYHAEVLHAALDRGLSVFCEKPLAMSWAEGKAMVERAEQSGARTQIGLVLRFSAVYAEMRALAQRAEMGRPMAVVFRDDQCFPIRGLHDSAWRKDRTLTAGGTMIEHGVHDVDLLTCMFGPMARLRAWLQNRAGHPGVEDYVAVEAEFEGGLRAQLVNLWHNVLQRHSNRRLEIFCDNGFVASDHDMLGPIDVQVGDGDEERLSADEVLRRFVRQLGRDGHPLAGWFGISYLLQDLCFVDALLEKRSPAPDLRAGLEAQRLVEAIYHAARTGAEVEVASFVPGDE
jgi:predicted dehydrogenase